MFNIADYFKKFAKIEGDTLEQRDAISKALFEACGIEGARFEVKKGIIYVTGSSSMRSAIYTKKGAILASIKSSLPATNILDIR